MRWPLTGVLVMAVCVVGCLLFAAWLAYKDMDE